ncbi:MAG: tetratricopeptide repeat protein [Thermoanaerobaculia bacterium]|nr:tetratricopeptide repeat protein [Thermoanaerobaculia bacterium]
MASKRESLIASAEKSLLKGKVDAALKDYLKVLEETPNDINVLNKVGDLFVRLGRNDESIPFFLRIAEHYARDGFYVRGIAMYKKINKLDPARLDIYEKLAELYVKQQLWMEAKSNYQVLADYLLKQDNLQGAVGIYQKMVAIEPQNLQLHVRLADLFTQAKRLPEALQEYAVVAAALSERGANEESIRVYEKALKLAPDNVDILRTLVPLLLSINSVEQARSVLRKGLEASPRSVPLFLLAAEAALAANDMAEARSYSDKARAVDPENEEVLAAAVRIQLKGRRPDLAWSAALPLAEASVRRGETKKALALLVPIARAAPDNEEIVRKIVDLAAGSGDEITALPFRSALAELYRKKGMLVEAADLLRVCARVQPDNSEFRARLTQLAPKAGILPPSPPRVPPPTMERSLEVTLSGFDLPERRPGAPAEVPPSLPEPLVPAPDSASEFEFDLDDAELAGEEVPAAEEAAPPTPPRGLPAPSRFPEIEADSPGDEPAWGTLSAAEALEAFEARQSAAESRGERSGTREAIGDLRSSAQVHHATPVSGLPAPREFDVPLEAPSGFGASAIDADPDFPPPTFGDVLSGAPSWPMPEAGTAPSAVDLGGPLSWGPASGTITPDAAVEDALVEADVFRRYGLLEKAFDQLVPWIEKAPGNLKVRERLFEITLEQGNRAAARAHGIVLAEAYEAVGRDDRIRGLEGLLGEPLRPVAELPAVVVEAPAEALSGAGEDEGGPDLRPSPAGEAAEPSLEESEDLEAVGAAAVPLPLAALDEPLTEILSGPVRVPMDVGLPTDAEPASPAVADAASSTGEPAALEVSSVDEADSFEAGTAFTTVPPPSGDRFFAEPLEAEEPIAEAAPLPLPEVSAPSEVALPEEPVEAPAEAATSVAAPLAPPETEEAPEAAAERRPASAPRTRLSAEALLGLDRPARPATEKVRAVRPEDVELDLLGKKEKPKAKASRASRADVVLPDDLLRSLGKRPHPPAVVPEDEAGSVEPAVPEATDTPEVTRVEEPIGAELIADTASTAEPVAENAALETDVTVVEETPAEEPGFAFAQIPPAPVELAEIEGPAEPAGELAEIPAGPSEEELSELDFCLDQGMVVDAAERLQGLEGRFPGNPDLALRRVRLEGGRGGTEASRASLHDLLSDDLDSVLDAELGRSLTEDMVRESNQPSGPIPVVPEGAPALDESGLFSDEQEFFNFADELHTELRKEGETAPTEEGREVSLEEIFRDFKKGVEQQLSPEDYETHYNLGIAYKEMGLTDEAIGEFQLAAKDPLHSVECCAMLGLCFLEKGLPQLAVKWYRKGLDTVGIKDDDRLGLQYALAGVLEQIGDAEGAYRTYLEIFSANANYRDVPARIKELRPIVAP